MTSAGHEHDSRHEHHEHDAKPSLDQLALSATVHCLIGCGIGEVLGFVIATALGWGTLASITIAVVLAFLFGYALTLWPLLAAGMAFVTAARLALAADTVSILVMEIVDNAVILIIPGAMDAGLTDFLFWGSLAVSLVAAFLAAYPVNRWLIARGRGHGVVHAHHQPATEDRYPFFLRNRSVLSDRMRSKKSVPFR